MIYIINIYKIEIILNLDKIFQEQWNKYDEINPVPNIFQSYPFSSSYSNFKFFKKKNISFHLSFLKTFYSKAAGMREREYVIGVETTRQERERDKRRGKTVCM